MKTKFTYYRAFLRSQKITMVLALALTTIVAWSQPVVPFTLYNNSAYTDANIYVAVVGKQNGNHVWIDTRTGAVKPMQSSDNTVQGPIYNGDGGPGLNGRYANCFARLSEIPNKVINFPGITGCRVLISFNSQLYLYFFSTTQGYAAPNLANPNDPNQGIRFEVIELSNADNGLWANTTRVDSYQYPMGLEVWGNGGFYKKVGEFKTHAQILSQWQSSAPAAFAGCYDAAKGIIHFPSKTPAFQPGGAQGNYFTSYIDQIWSKYSTGDLIFNSGDAGTWRGRVSGSVFAFTRTSDGQVARINRKPTSVEAMEGSGALAEGGEWDKVVQSQICAAINRHAIDLNLPVGATQDFATASKYYVNNPYNWYCKFWHQPDVSLDGLTYAFAYDDVFDKSSTINASSPLRATITIGGFVGLSSNPTGVTTTYKDCNYTGSAVALPVGDYNLAALNSRGILNNDISSLRVTPGYKVTLYDNDNFTGTSLVITSDNSCLVGPGWNDRATSIRVAQNTSSFSTRMEAENWISMSGVQTETTQDPSGGNLNVGWIEAGDWMAYDVNIPTAGTYTVTYRVASPNANTNLRLEKDAGATQLGSVTIPNTGSWQTWANVSHNVTLPAGAYSIGIATSSGGFNINYFTISNGANIAALSARGAAVEVNPETQERLFALSPNPVKDQLFIKDYEQIKQIRIFDIQGKEVIVIERPGSTISVQSLKPGIHIVQIERLNKSISKEKIVKE
ncbi:beta-1,3-glucanase family protein [Chryseosolibacter indicus]|uniref:Carbohydrate-binding protein n=1 Tax=Chryseosolibacter indicus TaxID=2782351 RepID=A0ABS5VWE7_9BACT|nr:beta-1,3-glucanase family protein [Chryseosolibacter indicus]MBT1704326.1 carbohydrate-binding protein [Chryseosolibacter indicus]